MSNNYSKRQGTSAVHGQLYETNLLSLINFRFLHYDDIETFHLATNVNEIGSFDDICFMIKLKGKKPFFVFIQAKHKEKVKRLFSYKTDMGKNFKSYLAIRYKFDPKQKDVLFQGNFDKTQCLFVMYSNAKNELTDLDKRTFTDTLDELIGTDGDVKKPFNSEKDVKYLCEIAIKEQINELAGRIVQFIVKMKTERKKKKEKVKNGTKKKIKDEAHTQNMSRDVQVRHETTEKKKIKDGAHIQNVPSDKTERHEIKEKKVQPYFHKLLRDELVRRYHVIMRQKVFEVSDIFDAEDPLQRHRMAVFRKEFFDNKEEHIILFREALYIQILKMRNLTNNDRLNLEQFLSNPLDVAALSKLIVTIISYNNGQLQLTKRASSFKDFRQQLKTVYVPQLKVIEAIELAAKEILTAEKFKVPTLFGNIDLTMSDHEITKLGDLLEKSETNEITIEEGFLKHYGGIVSTVGNILVLDKDPKYMKFADDYEVSQGFSKTLLEKLHKRIQNIHEYKLNFKVRVIPKLSFDCSLYEEDLARDFLNKLLFFTNQSNEAGVAEKLKKEIEEEQHNHVNHFLVNTDEIYLRYHNEIQTWWMTPKEAPYLTNSSKKFENVIEDILKDRLMSHVTYMTNINKTKCLNYTFEKDVVKCIKLQLQKHNILIAENCEMLLAKVIQYLKYLKEKEMKKLSSDTNDKWQEPIGNEKLPSNTKDTCDRQIDDKKLSSNTNDKYEDPIDDKKLSSDINNTRQKQIADKKLLFDTKDKCEQPRDKEKLSLDTKNTHEKQIHDKIHSSDTNNKSEDRINYNKLSSDTNDKSEQSRDEKNLSSDTSKTREKNMKDKKLSSDTNDKCEELIINDKKMSNNKLTALDFEYLVFDFLYILKLQMNEFKALSHELSRTKDKKVLIFVCDDGIDKSKHVRESLKCIAKAIGNRKIIAITNKKSVDIIHNHFIQTATIVSDDKHSIIDLTAKSQKSILENAKVVFQGKEVSLGLILDGELLKYVKGEVLNCVIQQKTIVVGKAIGHEHYDKTSYLDGRVKSNENGVDVKNLLDINDDVVIVTAKPGMGKSTLLTHLSLETKKIDPQVWIVRINLLRHCSKFINLKNVNTLETLNCLCHVILHEKFGKKHNVKILLEEVDGVVQLKDCTHDQWTVFELQLFLHFYNRKQIIFLFDGFDEIYSLYKEEVLTCINSVRNCPQKHKIWITSRPYNEIGSILRDEFGESHEMEPLSYSERAIYLAKFWKSNLILNEFDSGQLDNVHDFLKYMSESESRELQFEFERLLHEVYISAALYFINEIKHAHIPLWIYDRNYDDTYYITEITEMYTECSNNDSSDGTPLLLHLTADYFQNLIKANRETIEWNLDINTFDIYDKYLEKKLKIRVEEKYDDDICMPDYNTGYKNKLAKLILKHKQLGAYAIFHQFSEKLFNKKELKKIMNTIKFIEKSDEETGHICSVANGIPIFTHMTFTEYYAVEYICDVLKNERCREKQKSGVDFILNEVFAIVDLGDVHSIFDYKLRTDLTLKDSLLKNKDFIFDILLEQARKHSEYVTNLLKKNSSKQGDAERSRLNKTKRAAYDSNQTWALSGVISGNLRNVNSLFMSIFKSNLNMQNLDVFLNIIVDTNVLVFDRAKIVCEDFLIFILDFMRKNAKPKFNSLLTNNGFPCLRCLDNYEEMTSEEIIKQIRVEFSNVLMQMIAYKFQVLREHSAISILQMITGKSVRLIKL